MFYRAVDALKYISTSAGNSTPCTRYSSQLLPSQPADLQRPSVPLGIACWFRRPPSHQIDFCPFSSDSSRNGSARVQSAV